MLTDAFRFQALRRSIKGDKDKSQVSVAPKAAVAIVPPKKVCQADASDSELPYCPSFLYRKRTHCREAFIPCLPSLACH